MLIDGLTKKDLIETTCHFYTSMKCYKDMNTLYLEVWLNLYQKYGPLAPTEKYIQKVIKELNF